MKLLKTYLEEIDSRKKGGLSPKPIDNGPLLNEIITTFEDEKFSRRTEYLNFLFAILCPGTTGRLL